MNPVTGRLMALEPRPLEFLEIIHRLSSDQLTTAQQVLAIGPEIEASVKQAERIAESSQKVINLCLQLQPIPSEQPPHGF